MVLQNKLEGLSYMSFWTSQEKDC